MASSRRGNAVRTTRSGYQGKRRTLSSLLAVGREHRITAARNAVAVLLQAGQHRHVALLHVGAAEARAVARAGIVAPLCERGGRGDNTRNGKKQTGHMTPLDQRMTRSRARL